MIEASEWVLRGFGGKKQVLETPLILPTTRFFPLSAHRCYVSGLADAPTRLSERAPTDFYALAQFLHLKGMNDGYARAHLKPHLRKQLRKALRELEGDMEWSRVRAMT